MDPLPRGGDLPWALFFPAPYGVGSANLGIHHVTRALRRLGVGVERFFTGPGSPYRSVDNDTLLERFPVVTAGIAYENDLLEWIRWLSGASIPLSWRERRELPGSPVLGAGGSLTSINPLGLGDLCDFVVLGDGEPSLPDLVTRLRRGARGGSREDLWEALSELPHVLVPPLLERGRRPRGPGKAPELLPENAASAWITPEGAFGSTLLLELQRGCRRGCRFCTLPRCFTPLRRLPLAAALDRLRETGARIPYEQVGLITPEAGDYPEIRDLLGEIDAQGKNVSFASLRIDSLDDVMLETLRRGGRTALTLAPEAGTEALRRRCGKGFSDELILQKARRASEMGLRQAKLYFMLGLPGETEEDVRGIAALVESLLRETRLAAVLSVNVFVPKPGTPWGQEAFLPAEEYDRRIELLRRELLSRGTRRRVAFRFASHREAAWEYALSWTSLAEGILRNEEGRRLPPVPDLGRTSRELRELGYGNHLPGAEPDPADNGRCLS